MNTPAFTGYHAATGMSALAPGLRLALSGLKAACSWQGSHTAALLSLLPVVFPCNHAFAQEPRTRIAGRSAPVPCVMVDIGGQRAGHLDCAMQQLEEAARIARIRAGAAQGFPVPKAGSPDVAVGVSSLSGTRLRMGGNLGTSVHPARPRATPVNPLRPR